MANVGSLSGPKVLHTDMVKHSSSHLPLPEPVLYPTYSHPLWVKE